MAVPDALKPTFNREGANRSGLFFTTALVCVGLLALNFAMAASTGGLSAGVTAAGSAVKTWGSFVANGALNIGQAAIGPFVPAAA